MSEKKLVGNSTFFKCDECWNFKPLHDMAIVASKEDSTFCKRCWRTLGAIHQVRAFLSDADVVAAAIEENLKRTESVIDDNDTSEERQAWCFPINAEMRPAPPAGHRCKNCDQIVTEEEHDCPYLEDDE